MFENCFEDLRLEVYWEPWTYSSVCFNKFTVKACKNHVTIFVLFFFFFFFFFFTCTVQKWVIASVRNVGYLSKEPIFFSVHETDQSLFLSYLTLVKLVLIFKALNRRATKEKRNFFLQGLKQNLSQNYAFTAYNLLIELKSKYGKCTAARK